MFGTQAEVLCAACPAHLIEPFYERVVFGVENGRLQGGLAPTPGRLVAAAVGFVGACYAARGYVRRIELNRFAVGISRLIDTSC